MIFHLLYLQVRNNLNMSENARNKKKTQLGSGDDNPK